MNVHAHSRRLFVARLTSLAALSGLALTAAAARQAVAGDTPPARRPARPGNAVAHWNGIAAAAFTPSQGTNPMAQSRTLAILHAAIHDALNATDCRYQPYTPGLPAAPQASAEAWQKFVYIRDNPKGRHKEFWHHVLGCRRWLVVERDTLTHEVYGVSDAQQALNTAEAVQ